MKEGRKKGWRGEGRKERKENTSVTVGTPAVNVSSVAVAALKRIIAAASLKDLILRRIYISTTNITVQQP
jgi:hypothetical protein